jgi:hypothetical protein
MTHPTPSRRAQAASALTRPSTRRRPEERRRETERRMRRVAAWLRVFRAR